MTHRWGRLSAVLALLAGGIYAVNILAVARATTTVDGLVLMAPALLSMTIPFVTGAVCLWRYSTPWLTLAWGWVLGVHVPQVLTRAAMGMRPLPPVLAHNLAMVAGPDLFGLALTALALIGLALCIADEYGQAGAPNT